MLISITGNQMVMHGIVCIIWQNSNKPCSLYNYSNMALRLLGQTSIYSVVFSVSKSLLGIEKLKNFTIFSRRPQSHVRIGIKTNYVMLLSGILSNMPLVNCIFWYTHKPLGECAYRKGCITILYHAIKNSGHMGRLGVIQLNCTNQWEGLEEY